MQSPQAYHRNANVRRSKLTSFSKGKQDQKLMKHCCYTRNSRGEFSKLKEGLVTYFFFLFWGGNINHELCKGPALKFGHFGKQIRNI